MRVCVSALEFTRSHRSSCHHNTLSQAESVLYFWDGNSKWDRVRRGPCRCRLLYFSDRKYREQRSAVKWGTEQTERERDDRTKWEEIKKTKRTRRERADRRWNRGCSVFTVNLFSAHIILLCFSVPSLPLIFTFTFICQNSKTTNSRSELG